MAFPFAEILMDVDISPQPRGGPEFANIITTTLAGVEQVNVNRYDYISRYVIDYGLLQPPERKYVRSFHILRKGSAQGFRILAPDESEAKDETIANVATGTLTYGLVKNYGDIAATYVRRIVKPAWDEIEIVVGNIAISIQPVSGLGGVPLYGQSIDFGEEVSLDYTTGIVTVSSAFATAHNGERMSWNGQFHLPVRFQNDFNEMKHDFANSDWGSVELRELLPATLGIYT